MLFKRWRISNLRRQSRNPQEAQHLPYAVLAIRNIDVYAPGHPWSTPQVEALVCLYAVHHRFLHLGYKRDSIKEQLSMSNRRSFLGELGIRLSDIALPLYGQRAKVRGQAVFSH